MYGKNTEKSIRRTVRGKKLFSPITNPKSTPHKSIEIDIPYFGCISVDTFEESIEKYFQYFGTFSLKDRNTFVHVIHFMSHDIMSMIFKLVFPGIFLSNFDMFFDTFVRQK